MTNKEDWGSEEARYRRRGQLMREIGRTNRMETRMHILFSVVGILLVLALVLSAVS